MNPIDWEKINLGGYGELLEAVKRLEAALVQQESMIKNIKSALAAARTQMYWRSRYAGLYEALIRAGVPFGLPESQIEAWLTNRLAVSVYDKATVTTTTSGEGVQWQILK